jgi:hypothetical protein
MGVVRSFRPRFRNTKGQNMNRSTRAENEFWSTRAESEAWSTNKLVRNGPTGSHGYAEIRDPLHHGEGPP